MTIILSNKKRTRISQLQKSKRERRVGITPNRQTSEAISLTLYLLRECVDVASAQQHVKEKYSTQLQAVSVTVNTLTLEEDRKRSQLDREIGFVNECQTELLEVPSGIAIYRRPFSGLLEHDQPTKDKTSCETRAVDVSFGRKREFELREKIIPNDSENWNNWLGN